MNPILFESTAKTFTTNGLGRIEPMEAVVIEERNGQYELECTVPVGSLHYEDIALNRILAVVPGDKIMAQGFRIYRIDEPLNGRVKVYARHITYDLSYNTVMPFTASSVGAALAGLENNAVEDCPFTFWTDKNTQAKFTVAVPCSIRSRLGGVSGSILGVYQGEYEWDNWTVKLWGQRGQDAGVTLRYGKNITDLEQERNIENTVTGIVPYWTNGTDTVTLTEKVIYSDNADAFSFKRTVPVDLSSSFENQPTEEQLRNRAQAYVRANNIGIPRVSIKVSFVALWQSEEYKDIAPLERVRLCDTVGVEFERYGISARAEVVKTEWDVLRERYISIELGSARTNLASTISELSQDAQHGISEAKTSLQLAIDNATETLTGNKGGYIVFRKNENGQPYEILIMDTDDMTTAQNVWRFNQSGWGHSSHGINGPYELAGTLDNGLVADYITTGTLDTALLNAGVIRSKNDNTTWDLDSGILTSKTLVIDSSNFKMDQNGSVIASDLKLVNNANEEKIIETTNFDVSDDGRITATNADISGTIKTGGNGNNILINGGVIQGRNGTTNKGYISFSGDTTEVYGNTLNLRTSNLEINGSSGQSSTVDIKGKKMTFTSGLMTSTSGSFSLGGLTNTVNAGGTSLTFEDGVCTGASGSNKPSGVDTSKVHTGDGRTMEFEDGVLTKLNGFAVDNLVSIEMKFYVLFESLWEFREVLIVVEKGVITKFAVTSSEPIYPGVLVGA